MKELGFVYIILEWLDFWSRRRKRRQAGRGRCD